MKKFVALTLLLSTSSVLAAVPIVDLTDDSHSSVQTSAAPAQSITSNDTTVDALAPPTSLTDTGSASSADVGTAGADVLAARQSLPLEQRVKLLEQQLNNLTQMNLPGKIDSLEQQIQQLTGQLEQQTHTLQTLSTNPAGAAASNVAPATNTLSADNKTAAESTLADKIKASSNTTATTSNTTKPVENNSIASAESAVVQNTPVAKTAATQAVASANTTSEDKAYQAALDLLAKKKNDDAIKAFNSFIKTYPSSSYVPNAHYWLGELYGMTSRNDLASKEFTTIIQNYPTNAKVPDAMLKLAIMHDDAGQHAQAKRELQKIIHDYPNTAAARLAKLRLGNQ